MSSEDSAPFRIADAASTGRCLHSRARSEFTAELVVLPGSPEVASAKTKETLVSGLRREAHFSQGQGSRLLDLIAMVNPRSDGLSLEDSSPVTEKEMHQEIEDARHSGIQ